MKSIRRFFAIALTIIIIIISLPIVVNAEKTPIFFEDFNSYFGTAAQKDAALRANGWLVRTVDGASCATDGALVYNDKIGRICYSGTLKNEYSVSCDISFASGTLTSDGYAALVGGVNIDDTAFYNKTGYEFSIFIKKDGKTGYRLYRRDDTEKTVTAASLVSNSYTVNRDTVYHLELSFSEKIITGKINGEEVFSVEDDAYRFGGATFRLSSLCGVKVTYDNFKYDSIEKSDYTFYEDFSSYTQSTDDAKRSTMIKNGWGDVTKGRASYVSSGGYIIPSNAANDAYFSLSAFSGADSWKDYSVETKLKIGGLSSMDNPVYAGIAARVSHYHQTGYEFQLFKTSQTSGCRIYRRGNAEGTISSKELFRKEFEIIDEKLYTLKLNLDGEELSAYIDGEKIAQITDSNYSKGTVAVRSIDIGSNCEITYKSIGVNVNSYETSYYISASAGVGGKITPAGTTEVAVGNNFSFSVFPEMDYCLEDVLVDGVSVGKVYNYTLEDISSNHTVNAIFHLRHGDINSDGALSADDLILDTQMLIGKKSFNAYSDVNADGSSNITDLVQLKKHLADVVSAHLWKNDLWLSSSNAPFISSGETVNEQTYYKLLLSTKQYSNSITSADFDVSSMISGSKTGSVGLMFRRNNIAGKQTYYELRFDITNGEPSISLYRNGAENTELFHRSDSYIKNALSVVDLSNINIYRLTAYCVGQDIYCFLNQQLIGTFKEYSLSANTSGYSGYRVTSFTGTVCGFYCEKREKATLKNIGFTGKSIPTIYKDSFFDDTEDNLNLIDSDLNVFEAYLPENAMQAPEYSQNEIINTSVSVLGKTDFVKVFCSPRENGTEDIVYSPENDKNSIIHDSFNDSSLWNNGVEIAGGKWVKNHTSLVLNQHSYGLSTTCYRTLDNVFGNLIGVSADITLKSAYSAAGLCLNVGKEGYYLVRVGNLGSGNTLFLYRSSVNNELLSKISLNQFDLNITPFNSFHLYFSMEGSTLSIYINGVSVLKKDITNSGELFTKGKAGVNSIYGNAEFNNFRVYGTLCEEDVLELPKSVTYIDDFEDEISGNAPSHWIESETSVWKVTEEDGNLCYGMENATASKTYLHVFESNPELSLKFKLKDLNDLSKFGFFIREAANSAYLKIEYDSSNSAFVLKDTLCDNECQVYETVGDIVELSAEEWYNLAVIANGNSISVKLNGDIVLSETNCQNTSYGKIGFYAQNVRLFIDDFVSVLSCGNLPTDGIIEYGILPELYAANLEIEKISNSVLVAVGNKCVLESHDKGKTFQESSSGSVYAQLSGNGYYQSMLLLHDGSYIQVKTADFLVRRSTDKMTEWKTVGRVIPSSSLTDSSGRKLRLIHVNSLTEVRLSNGKYRIFLPVAVRRYSSPTSSNVSGHYTEIYYSDDNGATWNTSSNNTLDILPGARDDINSTWAESKIIRCADGSLAMYYSRNALGMMAYTLSYDEGVTWQGLYTVPYMQCAMTSFSIFEDPLQAGCYYMVFVNDTPQKYGSIHNRTRLTLAKTEDGINWKYVCDIDRLPKAVYSDDYSVKNPIYQILDPSITVTNSYIYVTYGRSNSSQEGTNTTHNAQQIQYVRLDRSKLSEKDFDASSISEIIIK